MKIKVKETTEREIELPKYFVNDAQVKFMLTEDGESFVKVFDCEVVPGLRLYPSIRVDHVSIIRYENLVNITPISETEFRIAFVKASIAIEETLNN